EAAAGGAEQEARLGAYGKAGLDQVLALGCEQPLALAVLALAQLADQLQLFVLGAGNHLVRFSVVVSSPGTPGSISDKQKRAVKTARPGKWSVWVAARRPHPPGLAPRIGERPRGRRPRSRRASCGSPRRRPCRDHGSAASSSCPRAAQRR